MAGLGAKKFATNSLLSSSDVNGYLADQVIMRFATSVARDAAFGGAGEPTLAEGMFCYLDDTDVLQSYTGSAWVQVLSADGKSPRGIVALASVSSTYAPTSAPSDFASVTFTAIANRYYKYSLIVPGADSDASRTLTMSLVDSANTAVNSAAQTLRGPGLLDLLSFTTIRTETAGSLTRKIRMTMSGGNGSMCSATSIGFFLVEDIGAV